MKPFLFVIMAVSIAACQDSADSGNPAPPAEPPAAAAQAASSGADAGTSLARVLDAQPADVQARYVYRHPKETLEFFGIEPGMTVVEGLPGGGWYSRILLNYLGSGGRLIGANYSMQLFPLFPFANEEFLARQAAWMEGFSAQAKEWSGDDAATVDGFYFGSMPAEFAGTADVVFFPRVLHNLANFQNAGKGDFLDEALADAYAVLKPGGIFAVVQHEARNDKSDEFASGAHGYLKKSWTIGQAEAAGFEFVAESPINANDKDRPGDEDVVWRLPPTYFGADEKPELRAAVDAIGESNRMTLKFRKPM